MSEDLTNPPTALSMTITTSQVIGSRTMTRYLCFTNYRGEKKSVPIELERDDQHTISGSCTGDGLAELQSLAQGGNRCFWDQMSLENHGGSTPLAIEDLTIQIDYNIGDTAGLDDLWERLKIVDSRISTELGAGHSAIDLEKWARDSRCRLAGLDVDAHPTVILAAHDIGKSGSDPSDQYDQNPKYARPDEALCSEFVSWYYHEVGVVINRPNEFRTIDFTGQVRDIFREANRLYRYNNATGKFLHSETEEEYLPQSGDFLERRKDGTSEHSMLVISWDASRRLIDVINGPWPVTRRRIWLSDVEQTRDVDFWVGRISPIS